MIDPQLSLLLLDGDGLVQRTGSVLAVVAEPGGGRVVERLLGICARSSVDDDSRTVLRRVEGLLLDPEDGPIPPFAVIAGTDELTVVVHGPMQLTATGPDGEEVVAAGVSGATAHLAIKGPLADLAVGAPDVALDIVTEHHAPLGGVVRAGGVAVGEIVEHEEHDEDDQDEDEAAARTDVGTYSR